MLGDLLGVPILTIRDVLSELNNSASHEAAVSLKVFFYHSLFFNIHPVPKDPYTTLYGIHIGKYMVPVLKELITLLFLSTDFFMWVWLTFTAQE